MEYQKEGASTMGFLLLLGTYRKRGDDGDWPVYDLDA